MNLIANFISSVTIGNAPLDVAFTNTSSGPFVRVEWDFGDGSKSTEINPTHVYTTDGPVTVSLTIYDESGDSTTVTKSITVLSSQSNKNNDSGVQQALSVTKRFAPGQVNVKKFVTTGSTFQTNWPISADTTEKHYFPKVDNVSYSGVLEMSKLNSTANLIYSTPGFPIDMQLFIEASTGASPTTVWLAQMLNVSGSTTNIYWEDAFHGTGQTQVTPKVPLVFYGIDQILTSASLVLLSNTACNRHSNDSASGVSYVFGYRQDNVLTSYGPNMNAPFGTLRFKLGHDETNSIFFPGAYSGATKKLRGFGEYVGQTGKTGQPYAVIYPQYSGDTSDRWYPGNVVLNIPWIMWHEAGFQNSCGIIAYDSADPTQRDEHTGLRYRLMRLGKSQQDTIIGKVYHDKKIILITDSELAAAMSYRNARSWTYAPPSASFVPDPTGWVSGGSSSPTGCSWYFSYEITEYSYSDSVGVWSSSSAEYRGASWGISSMGGPTGTLPIVPCTYIQRVDVPSGDSGVGYFNLTIPAQLNATGGSTTCLSNGNIPRGYASQWLRVFMATGATDADGPDPSSWRVMSGSNSFTSMSIWTADTKYQSPQVISIGNDSEYRYDISGVTWDWGAGQSSAEHRTPDMSGHSLFSDSETFHGDESILLGTVKGNYSTDIYKMSAVCVAKNNEFNNTQNETFDSTVNDSVYITEVGLYNESNDLLMVGKLAKPIKKNEQKFITVKLELDL